MQEGQLTRHQLLLMEIRDKLCGGNAAELARRIGKDSTYVNRLFYPEGKPGRKGIGLEIMQACNQAFFLPLGFWDREPPALDEKTLQAIAALRQARNESVHGYSAAPVLQLGPQDVPQALARMLLREPTPSYGMQPVLAWEHEDDLPPGEFVMVPRLDVNLSAGHGSDHVEIEFGEKTPIAFRADWIREQRLKPKKLAAMKASGDSMEPTIHDGDLLAVDTSQTGVVDGKVYALWYDGGERVKRLFRLPGGGLRIKSDNPAFDTIELGPEYGGHVRILGRVVHRSGAGGL